jgi:purine-binding chemotaxis protein CheW
MEENKEKQIAEEDLYDDEDDEEYLQHMYLTFAVGNEHYAIQIFSVTEIVGIQKITEVPDMPAYIKGVINLRGKVIPVMDVRVRFNLPERAYDDKTCIIVVNVNDTTIGLAVDTVSEVTSIPASHIEAPPQVSDGNRQRYIHGLGKIGEEVNIILDVGKLLSVDYIEDINIGASGMEHTEAASV